MKIKLFLILLFSASLSQAQSFQGTLTYVTDFELSEKVKAMGITKESLLDKMIKEGSWSDTVRMTYKQGNYYCLPNKEPKSFSIYKAETNKIYMIDEETGICKIKDASIDYEFQLTGHKPVIKKLDTVVVINGNKCDVVRVKWDGEEYHYYYNPLKLKVNPELFSRHLYDGWAEFLKISKALPVRLVKVTKGMMTVTMTLVDVKEKEVNSNLFKIPALVADKELNAAKPASNMVVMRVKK